MASLTSRSASKHVLFALGDDFIARDAGEGSSSDLVYSLELTLPPFCRLDLGYKYGGGGAYN